MKIEITFNFLLLEIANDGRRINGIGIGTIIYPEVQKSGRSCISRITGTANPPV